ncbi:MAG: flap endonuclease [Chloroflexi bacterium]|nr:flap endonuclease [Chloroflexota bacterium]
MKIHLVDATYELFRSFYGPPPKQAPDGREVGATVYLMKNLQALLNLPEVTHIACAFDHEIRSFRNDLFDGYKTGDGVDPLLLSQFELAEQAVAAMGIVVWPMVEFEADDAIATGTVRFGGDKRIEQVVVCSPDKDLTQLVTGDKVVCWDRRREIVYDEAAVVEKYGVAPASIPDYLALVGDAADGIPGIQGWGAKSAATVLAKFGHIEAISPELEGWGISAGRAKKLWATLEADREAALLYRELTTLRTDVPLTERLEDLEWQGARETLRGLCEDLGANDIVEKMTKWKKSDS